MPGMSTFATQEEQAQPFVQILKKKIEFNLASKIWKNFFPTHKAETFRFPIKFACRVDIQPECSLPHMRHMMLSVVGKTLSDKVLGDVKFDSLQDSPSLFCLLCLCVCVCVRVFVNVFYKLIIRFAETQRVVLENLLTLFCAGIRCCYCYLNTKVTVFIYFYFFCNRRDKNVGDRQR